MIVPHGDEQFQIYHWYGAGPSMRKASWVGQADTLERAEELVRAIYANRRAPETAAWSIVEPVVDSVYILDSARRQVVTSFSVR